MKKASDPVIKGACIGWRPPSNLRPSAWAARHVRIMNSERSPHFDPEQVPWVVAPLDTVADDEVRVTILIAPTGSGKSTLAEALVPYLISERPGNIMYSSQTDTTAAFWMETRLIPTMKLCEPLKQVWPRDRHKARKMEVIFPHMALVGCGANFSSFQEVSITTMIFDEPWTYKPGLIREGLARLHNRWNRKTFMISQGGDDPSELVDHWHASPMAEFGWKCPECGVAQKFSFDSVRFDRIEDEGGNLDKQATAKTARMECASCRAAFPDTVQSRRRLSTSNIGNGLHGYIIRNEKALDGYAGFHVDNLAVWWVPWGKTVLEWLDATEALKIGVVDKFRQWWQKERARFWKEDMADSKVEFVRSSEFTKEEVETAAPIEGEAQRFLTVDCGLGHFWCVVSAWRKGGSSRVLYEGYAPDSADGGATIEAIRAKYGVPPAHVLIDIGYDQPRIFDLMAKYGWFGIKGDGNKRSFGGHKLQNGTEVERLYSKTHRARSPSGPIVRFILIASNPVKDIAHRLLTGNGAEVELPADLSKTFELHCRAERREMVRDKNGHEKSVWVAKNRNNHLWDCFVYQVAAALVFRLFDDAD